LQNDSPFTIGAWATARYFDGYIDEVHLSSVPRSVDWISTEYNNQNSPATFYSLGVDVSYQEGDLEAVFGGYSCTDCTVHDFNNLCGINVYQDNINQCNSCETVYQTPGLMLDNRHNQVGTFDPFNPSPLDRGYLCGWAWNAWGASGEYGLGWVQFGPRVVTSTRPYVSTFGGNIYSKGDITGRYIPPYGRGNASYLIEAGGQITNFISSSTLRGLYQGELSGRPSIDFLSLGTTGKYENALASIDYTGLITETYLNSGVNKFGSSIAIIKTPAALETVLSSVLEGQVIHYDSGNLTLNNPITIQAGSGLENAAGVIVVEGDLRIGANINYGTGTFTNLKNIPSLAWIVKGNVFIDHNVSNVVGTFIVVGQLSDCGTDAPSCFDEDTDLDSFSKCGEFVSCYQTSADLDPEGNCDDSSLTVEGSVIAKEFELCRTYYDDVIRDPAENFINDGRLRANPPPGFEDFSAVIPRFDEL
ncbi:LamG domain-containing protein, partial [bacterium]|nr:LamG domain-containing protein [bacterium]